ncbi:hypothetical protein N1851_014522 [Merluccius polli]|uniref:Uncharacterized protein n=1 Tax=Merluccius polli TaxID=89951 RepID=A0AA47MT56_MERPO|nr:hypothetical protein N1851_014522 [Merluccius polli]
MDRLRSRDGCATAVLFSKYDVSARYDENETESLCLICHEELRSGRAGVLEVHCTHRFHREASRRLEHGRRRSSSSAAAECDVWRSAQDECPRSSKETDCLMPHRQFSLRRHR